MKIGILSMQNVNNFGSVLQSYSLMRLLKALGSDVSFIDVKAYADDDALLPNSCRLSINEAEKKGVIGKISKIDRYAINRFRIKHTSKKQDELFDEFREKYLEIEKRSEETDLCIIGSDEVFNCLTPSPWGFTSQLFGNVPNASHVITYAASCGATSFEQLPRSVKNRITEVFSRVEGVSVRDKNTYEFIKNFTSNPIFEHLDPVLIGDFDGEVANAVLPEAFNTPYCLVYSYYNRFHKTEEIQKIKSFCKHRRLKIIAVGAPQMWINDYYPLTPFEALKAFAKASFVVTDTFHGTIFSYKYSKRFAIIVRDSNRNKLMDLIDRLKLGDHLTDINCLENAFEVLHDAHSNKAFVEAERKKAECYLQRYL